MKRTPNTYLDGFAENDGGYSPSYERLSASFRILFPDACGLEAIGFALGHRFDADNTETTDND